MLSVVIPVRDEAPSLRELLRQLADVSAQLDMPAEFLFIDDGSTDDTWDVIAELAAGDARVHGIKFRRNFGKAAALTAGLDAAQGDVILTMDGDLQDDPAEIPRFLDKLRDGYDVVNGWKLRRLDPWHKVYPSKVFNWMVGRVTGLRLHDHNCGIKMFHAAVARELRLYGELHRFIPVLAHARGFKVTELGVNHRPRRYGYSKYGVKRFLRGFLDLITVSFLTTFGRRPLHLLGGIGLFCFAVGSLGMTWLGLEWVAMNVFQWLPATPIGDRPLLMYSVALLLLGAQVLSFGILAELIVANTGHELDHYSIAARTPAATPARVAVTDAR